MSRELILVIGGARSGKSSYAEQLASEYGEQVLYVATARARDPEMETRIAAHRAARPLSWRTLEMSAGVGAAIWDHLAVQPTDVVILDCLTLLVSNLLLGELWLSEEEYSGVDEGAAEERVEGELDALLMAFEGGDTSWIVVSNEVGWGLVPPYPVGRVYRDLLGRANQRVAAAADRVYLMIAGIPVDVKAVTGRPG